MTRVIPHSDQLETRPLRPGTVVHVQGIPTKVQQARVATHPKNWRLVPHSARSVKEVMTAAGHKEIHTDKWKRCVAKVKAQNDAVSPYAICTNALGKKSFRKNA